MQLLASSPPPSTQDWLPGAPNLRFEILWPLTTGDDTPRGNHHYAAGTPTYSGDQEFVII